MFDLDSRLLNIFYHIYKSKSISMAADAIGVSQPTISNGLVKIRQHFDDPLFLRVGNEMIPTELAKQIFPLVSEVINKVESINNFSLHFEPSKSDMVLTLAMTDVSHLVLLPKISNFLAQSAPQIRINVRPISLETSYQMANGEIDMAIGFLPQLEDGFYQQKLFSQRYVVISRKDHPRINAQNFTIEDYMRELHIDIDTGVGHYQIENALQNSGVKRDILIRLPSYLGVGLMVQETDAIATVPYYLSKVLLSRDNLQILNAPVDFPTYSIKQHWHMCCHHKTSHQWFRKSCYEIFKNMS